MAIGKEFKEFIARGNVIDLAVGVIIGGAFGKIVGSLVSDIVMPPIGLLLGKVDFSQLKLVLQPGAPATADSPAIAEVAVLYGSFLNTVIQFLIVAACIFAVVKAINSLKRAEEAKPAPAPPEPSAEEKLLAEIRDLLKSK